MTAFTRTDTSLLGKWWWTIDHWTLAAIALLIGFGVIMTMAASPPVADNLGYDSYHFVRKQLFFMPIALVCLIGASLMAPQGTQRVAIVIFFISFGLLVATFFFGFESKGAKRWINVLGWSLQPSEFIKPAFAVVTAWLFAMKSENGRAIGQTAAIVLYGLVVCLLLLQPDFGMTVVVSAVWFTQFFLAGLPLLWVAGFIALGIAGSVCAYFLLPHVASRVDRFIDPTSGDSYQVMKSMEAFMKGGVLGRGPGEGSVKTMLPDAHTDFIFAVAAEEFGMITCLLVVGLFAFIVLRGFSRIIKETNFFILLSVTGLLVQFGLQALINMASTLHLMPTKGMTLPFISYGGSSLVSVALCMGMVLSLTRRRIGQEANL